MSNALLRDITRKLSEERLIELREELGRWYKVINQDHNDKNKIYSLHEPDVCCISKSEEHKKYEFGSKSVSAITKEHCIIVGAKNFSRNEYDGHSLQAVCLKLRNWVVQYQKRHIATEGSVDERKSLGRP